MIRRFFISDRDGHKLEISSDVHWTPEMIAERFGSNEYREVSEEEFLYRGRQK